jgi:hypothetical protein
MKVKEAIVHETGYDSMSSFFKSAMGLKSLMFVLLQAGLAFFNVLMAFVQEWVWDPPLAVGIMGVLIILETITGSVVAMKKGVEFDPKKFGSGFLILLVHVIVLAITHNIAKVEPALFWLTNAAFGWFVMRNFLSLLKDLVFLKLIRGEFFEFVKSKLHLKDEVMMKKIDNDLKSD